MLELPLALRPVLYELELAERVVLAERVLYEAELPELRVVALPLEVRVLLEPAFTLRLLVLLTLRELALPAVRVVAEPEAVRVVAALRVAAVCVLP